MFFVIQSRACYYLKMHDWFAYALRCGTLIEELKESLSRDNIDSLLELMTEGGDKTFQRWLIEIRPEIESWLSLSPSQREKRKVDPQYRVVLTVGSIQRLIAAQKVLNLLEDHCLHPDMSYRSMAEAASRVAAEVLEFERSSEMNIVKILLDL